MTSDSKRWEQVKTLLKQALDQPAEEQNRFVLREAGNDLDLASEVLALLKFDGEKTGDFRETIHSVATHLRAADENSYIGLQVGRYRIVEKIAEGGMGSVYVAEHTAEDFDHTVAIKLLPRHRLSEDAHRRFVDERRILAGLQHPNITPLIDGGTLNDGTPYIVMELVDGVAIDQYCKDKNLSNEQIISLVRRVCDALQYAHRKLVIHRDIKPSNIMVTNDGVPKLLDFGIAKLLDEDVDVQATRTEQRVLTPMYASPEQLEGMPITTAADVYGAGLLLYRLLTGKMPYTPTGQTPRELEQAILSQNAQKPSTVIKLSDATLDEPSKSWRRRQQKALRGDLDTILLTALQKQPERRYDSVADLATDLERFQKNHPIAARPDSAFYVAGKFLQRHRLPVGLSSVAMVAALGMTTYYTEQLRIERDVATETAKFLTNLFEGRDPYRRNKDGLTVASLVDDGLEKLKKNKKVSPEVRVRLLSTISQVKRNLGELDSAAVLAEQALSQAESHGGKDSALVLPPLTNLINIRRGQDDHVAAMSLAKRMLQVSEATKGKSSPEVAQATHLISIQAYRLGDLDEMGKWAKLSFDLRKKIYAADDPALAVGANALGLYHWQTGDFVAARKLYEQALEIESAQPEPNVMNNANKLHNIGLLYNDSGEYVKAVETYERSLALRRSGGNPKDSVFPMTLYALAHSQSQLGDKAAAHLTYLQQVPLQVAVAGRDKESVAYALTGHGMLLEEMGDVLSAARLLQEADRIYGLQPDLRHPDRAATWIGLGRVATAQKDWQTAKELMQDAIDVREENSGEEHTRTLRARIALGRVVFLSGDLNLAAQMIDEVRVALTQLGYGEEPAAAEAAGLRGRISLARGEFAEANDMLALARTQLDVLVPEGHPTLAQYAVWQAEALSAAGRTVEAQALTTKWAPVLEKAQSSWRDILVEKPVPAVDEYLAQPKLAPASGA